MAARTRASGGTGKRSSLGAPNVLLRFLTAALAGGAVLLLWGGTAGAAEAGTPAAPAPATSEADSGLLGGLVGEGGALTPVVELVDATTSTLTGTTPVGTTVTGAVTTVGPIVTPVAAPVSGAADPILAPVIETVGDVTTTVVEPVTGTIPPVLPPAPGTPGTPATPPVVPPTGAPILDPTGSLVPELPPLLPPDPTAEPGAIPGTDPTTSAGPSAPGSAAPLPLVTDGTSGRDGRSADGTPTAADLTAGGSTDHPVLRFTPSSTDQSTDGHDGPGAGHQPAGPIGVASVPAPCSGPGSATAGAPATVAHLASPTASPRCGATSLETPAGMPPHSAPASGPDVAPD